MIDRIRLLTNPIRDYAWGSHSAIAELQGRPAPTERPEAELWMGAHPNAPSRLCRGEDRERMDAAIARRPRAILGERVAQRYQGLPFLFKVLAAEQPLSIQAHPDSHRARAGFARENAAGLAPDDPQRSYRDARHKPELVCALSPFLALRGFRAPSETRALLERLEAPGLAALLRCLDEPDAGRGLHRLLETLLRTPPEARRDALDEAVTAARTLAPSEPAFDWVVRLGERYPDDAGVLAPLFLHLVRLEPGEAMYLPPGELHAHLAGTCVEVMANSDNVVRGGLTHKHVDVVELLEIVRFEPGPIEVVRPAPDAHGRLVYATPAAEFELSRLEVQGDTRSFPASGAEILLCTEGALLVRGASGDGVALSRGDSCLVPDAAGGYRLEGSGTLFRASVPPG